MPLEIEDPAFLPILKCHSEWFWQYLNQVIHGKAVPVWQKGPRYVLEPSFSPSRGFFSNRHALTVLSSWKLVSLSRTLQFRQSIVSVSTSFCSTVQSPLFSSQKSIASSIEHRHYYIKRRRWGLLMKYKKLFSNFLPFVSFLGSLVWLADCACGSKAQAAQALNLMRKRVCV